MDLGIAGRTAVICASSKGLGYACALELGRAGVELVINGRDSTSINEAAARLREACGGTVETVAADLATVEGRERLLSACPTPDILVTNNGGPPPRSTTSVNREDLLAACEMNMFAAVELIQAVAPSMVERTFGRIVNITSAAVEIPLEGLATSSAARAGLSSFSAVLARRYAGFNVTINNVEPGFFATDRILSLAETGLGEAASLKAIEARFDISVPARRLGLPAEFGALCAFLCSAQAGFITGQKLLIDGGLVARL